MDAAASKLAFHPFATEALPLPSGGRTLALGPGEDFQPPPGFGGELHAVQGFRPAFLALQRRGFRVEPRADGGDYDLALVFCGRHRGRNETRIAEALRLIAPGARVVVAGSKEDGIDSLRKRIGAVLPAEGALAKYHGAVFWLRRPERLDAALLARIAPQEETRAGDGFVTRPGLFSHGRIDPGSRLLAEALPADLKGRAADFCAGWGFLAARLLRDHPGVAAVDLYEAEYDAVEAARTNLAQLSDAEERPCRFFWHDLAGEPVAERYDVIVMNPPFHRGRAAEPELGQTLIRAAAAALRRGGALFMVANRQLAYEATLRKAFREFSEIAGDRTYKVLCAVR